jgi:haloalkane dehalogenase
MQDWGGPIGLGYAVENPDRIKRLVIMSTWAFELPSEFGEQIPALFKQCREPWLGEALLLGYNIFVEGFLPVALIRKERITEQTMRAYRAPFPDYNSRIPTMAIQDVPLSPDQPSFATMKGIEGKLSRLNVPTALIWGKDDALLEVNALTQMWKQIYPHSELHLIPRAGHFLQEDAPEEVVAAIKGFLTSNP